MKLFKEFNLKNLSLKNRLVMPPMCMYKVDKEDGIANSFHKSHYIYRAIANIGLIIVESTAVSKNGRISDYDLGLWDDSQINDLKDIVDGVHENGSQIAIQLNHAGRKADTKDKRHIGPSKVKYNNKEIDYDMASIEEIEEVIKAFGQSAKRAHEAGFDAIEIHSAHGYLIHQFISPISNQRDDEYGKDRFLFLKKVVEEIRKYWPDDKALLIRISATDYLENGLKTKDWIDFFNEYPNLFDLIHVSAGGIVNTKIDVFSGYMLQYAKKIRQETNYPTIGVGLLNDSSILSLALEENYCDLVASGRELLRNPNLLLDIARDRNYDKFIESSYKRAY